MENDNKVRAASIRLSTVATTTRQTPKTDFGTVMRDGLVKAGNVAVEGLRVAAPFVPGGSIISAALAGANATHGMIGGPYGGNFGGDGAVYGTAAVGSPYNSAIGTTGAGLTAGAAGGPSANSAVAGNYNADGTLAIPGRRPGIETSLNQSPNNFSGSSSGYVSSPSDAFNQMMSATKQMSEFQASFNLQYLQLQEKIQIDSRQFNLISNIMKSKHDAAKNALNNVR